MRLSITSLTISKAVQQVQCIWSLPGIYSPLAPLLHWSWFKKLKFIHTPFENQLLYLNVVVSAKEALKTFTPDLEINQGISNNVKKR